MWRLPRKHLVQLPGGRHLCSRRGSIVDPKAGTETPLSECAGATALVRGHACRLLAASVGVSLALTCGFAEVLNEAQHRETLKSISNLARLLQDQGKLPEAEALFREALVSRTSALGTKHRDTVAAMANLARLCQEQGELAALQALDARRLSPAALDASMELLPDLLRRCAIERARRAAAEDAGTECVVCLEDARSVAFGCGHLCVCEACAPTVVACPLCREPVRAKQRIYFD